MEDTINSLVIVMTSANSGYMASPSAMPKFLATFGTSYTHKTLSDMVWIDNFLEGIV